MESEFRDGVVQRVRTVMRMREMSQKDLATASGYSEQRISTWLRASKGHDDKTPNIHQLADIAQALRTTCDYLVGLVDDPASPSPDRIQLPQRMVESALQHVMSAQQDLRAALEATAAPSVDETPNTASTASIAARREHFAQKAQNKRSHSGSDIST